jgi:hypothetical protein
MPETNLQILLKRRPVGARVAFGLLIHGIRPAT